MKLLLFFIIINVGVISCKSKTPDINMIDIDSHGAFSCAVLNHFVVLTTNRVLNKDEFFSKSKISMGINNRMEAKYTSEVDSYVKIGEHLVLVVLSEHLPENPAIEYSLLPQKPFALPSVYTVLNYYYYKGAEKKSYQQVRIWMFWFKKAGNLMLKGFVFGNIGEENAGVGNLVYKGNNQLIGIVSRIQTYIAGFAYWYIVTIIDLSQFTNQLTETIASLKLGED